VRPLPRLHAVTDETVAVLPDLGVRAAALASVGPAVALTARLRRGTAEAHADLIGEWTECGVRGIEGNIGRDHVREPYRCRGTRKQRAGGIEQRFRERRPGRVADEGGDVAFG